MFLYDEPNPLCLKCQNSRFSGITSKNSIITNCKFNQKLSRFDNDCPLFCPRGKNQIKTNDQTDKWEFYQSPWNILGSIGCLALGAFLVLVLQSDYGFVAIILGGFIFLMGICLLADQISNWNKPELIFDDRGIHSRKQSILWSEFKNFKLTKNTRTYSSGSISHSYQITFHSSSSKDICVDISSLKGDQELVKQQILNILHDKTGGWS